MKRTINTVVIDENNNASFQSVMVERSGQYGFQIKGVPEKYAKEILLKTLMALQACGFKVPEFGIKITVSNHGTNINILTAPIAVAILVLSRQIKPIVGLEDLIIAGDLKLNGELNGCYTYQSGFPLRWPGKKTQFFTNHSKMHIFPQGSDFNLAMTEKGPFTVEAYDLKTIQDILECNSK